MKILKVSPQKLVLRSRWRRLDLWGILLLLAGLPALGLALALNASTQSTLLDCQRLGDRIDCRLERRQFFGSMLQVQRLEAIREIRVTGSSEQLTQQKARIYIETANRKIEFTARRQLGRELGEFFNQMPPRDRLRLRDTAAPPIPPLGLLGFGAVYAGINGLALAWLGRIPLFVIGFDRAQRRLTVRQGNFWKQSTRQYSFRAIRDFEVRETIDDGDRSYQGFLHLQGAPKAIALSEANPNKAATERAIARLQKFTQKP